MSCSGRCICQHNTVGDNCERCEPGYYGYALGGRPEDCQRCPCPGGGECVELLNGEVSCINCQEGYTGKFINPQLFVLNPFNRQISQFEFSPT